jgi:hypothetical protein
MGRPEETAGLLQMGFSLSLASEVLGISTASTVDYLYRAVGKRYITIADIVLSIPRQLRDSIDAEIARQKTENWFSVYNALQRQESNLDAELLRLYLHLRGTVIGELYFLVTEVEKLLHAIIVFLVHQDYPYRYFSELTRKIENLSHLYPETLATIPDLPRSVQLRNRVMHPTPPFQPTDEDFEYIRNLRTCLSDILSKSLGTQVVSHENNKCLKLETAAKNALDQSEVWKMLDDETKRCISTH